MLSSRSENVFVLSGVAARPGDRLPIKRSVSGGGEARTSINNVIGTGTHAAQIINIRAQEEFLLSVH